MQDETSIPEDIFDQRHLREIEENERKVGKKTLGVATDVADGDDVIDVNLPYDDTDADAEADADIILESQRSIERNFSNDNDSGYNKNQINNGDVDRDEGEVGVRADSGIGTDGIGYVAEVRPKDNAEALTAGNLKKQNINKKYMLLKDKKKLNFVKSNDKKRQQGKEIKYENYIESTMSTQQRAYTYGQQLQQQLDLTKDKIDEDNYYDGYIDDEEDDDDGSAEYERFKLMHEQKQKERDLQKERETLEQEQLEMKRHQQQQQDKMRQQQQQQQELDNRQQQQKYHMSSWKKLNEEKFNKQLSDDNEETMMVNMYNSADQDDNNADSNKNNDEIAEFDKPQQQEEEKSQQQQEEQHKQQQQQDAIGDIDDAQQSNEYGSILKKTKNSDENKDYTNVFIPRKMKRHNGAARLDDVTNRYTRIKKQQHQQEEEQEQQQEQKYQHQNQQQQSKSENSNGNDKDDAASYDVDNQDEYMPHFGTQRGESVKKSYYGIINRNSTPFDDSNEPKDNSADNKDNDKQHANGEGKDIATIKTTPPLHEGNKGQTLFEKEKSLRRNNKHYGHKTHKKKYKDYLRYSSLMMIRAPTTASPAAAAAVTATAGTTTPAIFAVITPKPTTTTTRVVKLDPLKSEDILRFHKDNYERKLKLNKLKGRALPASPIFALKASKSLESHEKLDTHHAAAKPFYEGQINYYLETDDDDDMLGGRDSEARFITKGDRMDTNDWYRKLSPVLRNGVKSSSNNNDKDDRMAVTGVNTSVNGVSVSSTASASGNTNGAVGISGGYTPYHHYRNHHQQHSQHHHHNNHQNNQKHHHHQHSRHHAYQRKMLPKKIMLTTTPLPPPSRRHETNSPIQELAHQITDVKEFERYYAKWPHLARVQSQLHDEQLREQLELQNLQQQQMGNYQDYEYDEDYFEALQSGNVEENVPPYIRKYNRRNKQLLDLLEGTLPPPTRPPQQLRWSGSKLQPGPRDSSVGSVSVRIDDDYLKEKRKRYHQRQKQIHDLFEQQRTITTTTTMMPTTYSYENNNGKMDPNKNHNHYENHLPDEDISISMETQEHDENQPHNWQTITGSKSPASLSQLPWQRDKLITTSSAPAAIGLAAVDAAAATLKPAIYKLPSYPSIAGSFIQRPRSRSAQFAPSSGSEYRRGTPFQFNGGANNFINAGGFVAFNGATMAKNNAQQQNNGKSMSARFSANYEENNKALTPNPDSTNTSNSNSNKNKQHDSSSGSTSSVSSSSQSSSSTYSTTSSSSSSPASVSNSFVYHRVIDASPRFVGAGLTGRKQRLPFVAITDRRLETSKKSLTEHQKDFEQNHYPMP